MFRIWRINGFIAGMIGLGLLFGAAAARGGTIVIDNFDSPTASDVFITADIPNIGIGSGHVIVHESPTIVGTEREVLVDVLGQPIAISAAGIIGFDPVLAMGTMQIATSGPAATVVALKYDGLPSTPGVGGGEAQVGMVADLTDGGLNDEFVIRFLSCDGGDSAGGLSMAINVSDGGIGTALWQGHVPESESAYGYSVNFSAFNVVGGGNPFANAASITVVFNGEGIPNVDYKLDFIAVVGVVPEPSTAVLLLSGLCLPAALLRRKISARRRGVAKCGTIGRQNADACRSGGS